MKDQGLIADAPLAALLAALPLARRTRIVDGGANPLHDAAPYAGLLRAGGCDVVGFEPRPEPVAALEKARSDRETYDEPLHRGVLVAEVRQVGRGRAE